MARIHYILRLSLVLCFITCAVSGPNREREANAPPPTDCVLSSWGKWSECDPCTNLRHRSRSIEKFGQYGGLRCLSSLGESQLCKPSKPCKEARIDCGNDFECESGRCIKRRLLCNIDNDCGDHSDELCEDDQEPKSPCRSMDIELSEIGRVAGNGLNILGMSSRRNPFDNEYFNGVCERVRDGNTKTYYRKPWNVANLVYQTKADKSFTTEIYEDSIELLTKIIQETTQEFQASLSLKVTSTEANDTSVTGSLGINTSRNESIQAIKQYAKTGKKTFIKVSGTLQLASYHMRTRGVMLSSSFLDDLKTLPTTYEKAEYYSFLEMYGTHYALSGILGGKYELVYVLDSTTLKAKDITTKDVTECLGYDLGLSVASEGIEAKAQIKNPKCSKVLSYEEGNTLKSGVIENVISFVEGGTLSTATGLDEKLGKTNKDVGVEDFVKWASSIVDSPVLIKQKPAPIYTLIPPDMKDAYIKSRNLERAIEDYLDEHSVCKCHPCQNGGTAMVIDGECLCKCPEYFTGVACQTVKSDLYKGQPKPIDGNWGCWSPSSSCLNGEITLTRQCNNPPPQANGKDCDGERRRTVPC
ncbi:complement component C9-like [Spea bombifrons]|uniref:complement component C9-like n=1 Tax=Spea bombifrons TaxID=233779 RepID=UPI00234BA051|nr:complement component C9-like [Spea bombifrons]